MKANLLLTIILLCTLSFSCKQKDTQIPIVETEMETPNLAKLEYKIKAELGEGAFWNHKTQEFYWVDILGKQLHIYNPETKKNRSFPTPSLIGTVVPKNDSLALVALEDGVYMLNTVNGSLAILSDVEKELTINRFNDGKCDPNGNLWVGSMHLEQSEPKGSVYKIDEQGKTEKMIDSVTISNGIVWTSDHKTMYYIDTPTATIRAYDYDVETATISNERAVVTVDPKDGFPDGMAIDSEDMLWVGMWNGNAVARFNPKTGALISKIEVPAHNVTACAFGGPNLNVLYITTASVDMTEAEKEQYPLAGSIFVANPGVAGVKSDFFGAK
ncbi:SMP-30/gluconolactonase/LRE family protein [Aureisphaera galaxeae]|uniref:SMP-30/gluconolactonase/LRE family protein n=1 Tax=Aureisphaera galaxeae TaxID=1538023 RepID=UPI002350D61B|nr:SMP-30/gluconolactonase/LRE family protein [Aureisphaera galaxeae]MDC8004232.1 SMP-30/gluconolactonase/LRE family protein [Aureisphaera galaxeae]